MTGRTACPASHPVPPSTYPPGRTRHPRRSRSGTAWTSPRPGGKAPARKAGNSPSAGRPAGRGGRWPGCNSKCRPGFCGLRTPARPPCPSSQAKLRPPSPSSAPKWHPDAPRPPEPPEGSRRSGRHTSGSTGNGPGKRPGSPRPPRAGRPARCQGSICLSFRSWLTPQEQDKDSTGTRQGCFLLRHCGRVHVCAPCRHCARNRPPLSARRHRAGRIPGSGR